MWWNCGCIVDNKMKWGKLSKEETGQVRKPLCTCYPSAEVANRFGASQISLDKIIKRHFFL